VEVTWTGDGSKADIVRFLVVFIGFKVVGIRSFVSGCPLGGGVTRHLPMHQM